MSGLIVTDHVDFREGIAPSNPAAGTRRTYWKADGFYYTRDSAGTERAFLLSTVPETNKVLLDNLAEAWAIVEGTSRYMIFTTSDGFENITLGADPAVLTNASLLLRAGLGGLALTSTGGLTIDSAAALAIESSAGTLSFGADAVNQNMIYGSAGTRTLTFGSATATWIQTVKESSITVGDNEATAWLLQEGANPYLKLTTTNAGELMDFGNATTNPAFNFLGTGLFSIAGTLTPAVYDQVAGDFTYNVAASTFSVTSVLTDFVVPDNTAGGFKIREGANSYYYIDSSNGAEVVHYGANSINPRHAFYGTLSMAMLDNTASAFELLEGANSYIKVDTSNGAEQITFGQETVVNARLSLTDGVVGGQKRVVGGRDYASLADSTTLASLGAPTAFDVTRTVPANTLKAGSVLKIKAVCRSDSVNGADTLQYTLRLTDNATGAQVMVASTPLNVGGGNRVLLEGHLVFRAAPGAAVGASGFFESKDLSGGAHTYGPAVGAVLTYDTTHAAGIIVDVLCTHSGNNAANQSVLESLYVEII